MPDPAFAVLAAACGASPSLERVSAAGRASGPLLSMTVRQHYRNRTSDTLETVYTFPLPWGAVLTGLSVEIGGRRLDGVVLPRADAQARYEEAIGEGDAPVMVEKSSDALHTANLGNLKPGEAATVELRYAQLLPVEQGRVRLSVPTTIAPRHGDPARDAGVREHESVGASVAAAYPFEFSLRVEGALAAGAIASPTHAIAVTPGDGEALVRLCGEAWLDRDLVLTFEGAAAAHALRAPDGSGRVVLASFCPALGAAARASVDVKLLVDCSGSMGGDSIASARRGLHRALAELRPSDRFSYSRFGSRVEHASERLRAADAHAVAHAARLVEATQADLGGTEMHAALASTFALGGGEAADVLLVTDGEVWAIDAIVEAARASGHRVFAVGVGSAPAESLLRRLAEETGGACELASPDESIEDAIGRTLARLRVARARDVRVDWGGAPEWSTRAPLSVFDGDTVHVAAGFAADALAVAPTLVFTVDGEPVPRTVTATVEDVRRPVPLAPDRSDGPADEPIASVLPRIAAARRIADAAGRNGHRGALGAWVRDLAVRYGLVTGETNLFLVHRREGADKADGLPVLQKIEQMLAAGWGATGSVRHRSAAMPGMLASLDARSAPSASPHGVVTAAAMPIARRNARGGARWTDAPSVREPLPAFLRAAAVPVRATPRRLLSLLRGAVDAGDAPVVLLRRLALTAPPAEIAEALRELEAAGASREEAWLIVLAWLARQVGDATLPGEAAVRALDAWHGSLHAARREIGERILERLLGKATLGTW